jgi:hypothetical protein
LKICLYFPSLEPANVWIELNSFKYVANSLVNENVKNPLLYIYKANFGYTNLKKLAECLMCVPVSTATAKCSFSTMNRIMKKKNKNKMGQETLQSCMKISIEGHSKLDEDTVNEIIDLYARQKQCRIHLI